MKRIFSLLAIFTALLFLVACGTSSSTGASTEGAAPKQEASAVTETQTQPVVEETTAPAAEAAASTAPQTEPQETASQENQTTAVNNGIITEEDAKRIALEDAGVNEEALSGIHIQLEMDGGIQEYEVEFYVGTQEYDYEINASDGTIRSKDSEIENIFPHTAAETGGEATFSEADAIALVLSKVPGATEDLVRIHLDRDDGILIYEGSLVYDGMEYDFEIHGETGAVLEWEAERND